MTPKSAFFVPPCARNVFRLFLRQPPWKGQRRHGEAWPPTVPSTSTAVVVDARPSERALPARARSWYRHGRRPPPRAPAGGRRRLPARRALPAHPARRRRVDVRGGRALAAGTAPARSRGRRPRRRLHGVRRHGAAVAPTTARDDYRRTC